MMRRVSHLRNLIISIAVIVGILLASELKPLSTTSDSALAAGVKAPLLQTDFIWSPTTRDVTVIRGNSAQATYTLIKD
jgi:hypothetical protein